MKLLLSAVFILVTVYSSAQTYEDGMKALYNERYETANLIFGNLLQKNPNDAHALFMKGHTHFILDQKDSAKYYFNKGAAIDRTGLHHAGMAKMMLDAGNAAGAKTYIDKAAELAGKTNAEAYKWLGEAYITSKAKSTADALNYLNKSLAIDKKNTETYILAGDAHLLKVDGGGLALTNYELATEINPSFAKGFTRIGQLYMRSKSWDEALKNFKKAIEADPAYAPAYRELAEFYHRAEKHKEAEENYSTYLSMADSTVQNLTRYVYMVFLNKNFSAAENLINSLRQKDSSNVILDRLLGYSYYENKKYPEGIQSMEKFFSRVEPAKVIDSDYEYFGKLHLKGGNDSLGIIYLLKAFELDTTNTGIFTEIATTMYQKRNYAEAARFFEMKGEKAKLGSLDYYYMGRSYYYAGEYSKADSTLAFVTERQPNYGPAWYWRGQSSYKLDEKFEKDTAKTYMEKFIEISLGDIAKASKSDLCEAYRFLGYRSIQKDKNAEARTYYSKLLEVCPDDKQAKDVLQKLK